MVFKQHSMGIEWDTWAFANFLWVCLIFLSKNGQWSAVGTNPWVWVLKEVFPWCWGWGRQTWFQNISITFRMSCRHFFHHLQSQGPFGSCWRCNKKKNITSSAPRETRTAPTSTEQNWETKGNHKEHSLYSLDFRKLCPCFFPPSQAGEKSVAWKTAWPCCAWQIFSKAASKKAWCQRFRSRLVASHPKKQLVGGIPTPLKTNYKSQIGWWHSQHMEGHNPVMFQTTNQMKVASLIASLAFNVAMAPFWGHREARPKIRGEITQGICCQCGVLMGKT